MLVATDVILEWPKAGSAGAQLGVTHFVSASSPSELIAHHDPMHVVVH